MTCGQWIKRGIVASGLLVLGAMPVKAQGVEAIMRARESLELTDQQVEQLDAIRQEAVAQRNAEMAQMSELRSQLAAGQIRRSDLMAAMEDRQDAREARAEQRRASIEGILTAAQLEAVDQMRRRFDRQRPGAGRARPRGGRGGPGFGRGRRYGFEPGAERGPGPGVGLR